MLALLTLAFATTALGGLTVGPIGEWTHQDDTPAFSFLDSDGKWYMQSSHSGYGIGSSRRWSFYTGENFDSLAIDKDISDAVSTRTSRTP